MFLKIITLIIMVKLNVIVTVLLPLLFSACKKDYTCVCSNPSATNHDFYNILNEKKKVAEQKCKDYYNATYANEPMNEISCEIKTK